MSNDRDLDAIFDRIAKRNATDEDIQTLRQLLRLPEGQNVIQIGKYSVSIAEGRDIHIGDRIYQSTDAETIRAIVQQVLAEKIRDDTFQRLFSPSESSLVDWDWGMNLLKKKQLPEIRKRLTDTLGRDRILMDVSIEERQRLVNRSPLAADRTLQVDGRDCGTLNATKMLIETFGRDDIEKKLLILGAPGAGKTTALLSLAEQLVEGAISQPRTVIPVIFELSTWRNDNQSIESWLIEQSYDLHGGNRKSKLYEQWLERQVLLPLLDGLDELGLERQKKCTQKLNEFAEHYPHLVVCCRVKEFKTVDIKLRNLRGAVYLQSLFDSQIQHYFDSLQRPELWEAIQTTPSLQAMLEQTTDGDPGLLRVPLFIKLVADVYDPQQPISGKTDLLDKYIDWQLSFDKREFDRRKELKNYKWAYNTGKEPNLNKTRNNLSWLAQNLQGDSKVEFLIEHIQPSSIPPIKLQYYYRLIFGLVFGMGFELIHKMIYKLINEASNEPINNWIEIFNDIMFTGLFFSLNYLQVGNLRNRLISGFVTGVTYKLLCYIGRESESDYILFNSIVYGLIIILIGDLIKIQPIEALNFFMQSNVKHRIFQSLKKWTGSGIILGIIFYLISKIVFDDKDLESEYSYITAPIMYSTFGGLFGAFIGIILGTISNMKKELDIRYYQNQGIWNSLQIQAWTTIVIFFLFMLLIYAANYALASSIFVEMFFIVANSEINAFSFDIDSFLEVLSSIHDAFLDMPFIELDISPLDSGAFRIALFVALIFSFGVGGGKACLQHLSLRIVLWKHGLPWNFARFLNYCVERRLLLRVGGSYRFLHRELLDHFAQSNH